jgi:N-acetylglucosamine-6-phosphate deacetylase
MDAAFRLVVTACGFSLLDAVQAASVNPARLLRRADIGSVEVGRTANLVALDSDLVVQQVWHRGAAVRG